MEESEKEDEESEEKEGIMWSDMKEGMEEENRGDKIRERNKRLNDKQKRKEGRKDTQIRGE